MCHEKICLKIKHVGDLFFHEIFVTNVKTPDLWLLRKFYERITSLHSYLCTKKNIDYGKTG